MQIGDFLTNALKQRKISKKDLSIYTGLTPSYISQICLNKKMPTLETVQRICDVLSISLAEFFASSEAGGNTLSLTPNEQEYIKIIRSLPQNEQDAVWAMVAALSGESVPVLPDVNRALLFPKRNVDGYAAAGVPLFDDTNSSEMVSVPEKYLDRKRYFIVQARGNSMVPRIYDGDYVVVEKDTAPEQGEIALVRVDGIGVEEYTIKRFYTRGKNVELRSYNEKYNPMFFSASEIKSAEKVVHIISGGNK